MNRPRSCWSFESTANLLPLAIRKFAAKNAGVVAGDSKLHVPQNALRHRRDIAARLKDHRVVVFLDYDGTLTPIASRPELATLDSIMRDTVKRLSGCFTTVVISGRACADVRRLVGIPALHYAGNHGLEIEGPNGTSLHQHLGEDHRQNLHRYAAEIHERIGAIEGVLIEDKNLSLSVHFRLVAPERVSDIEAAIDQLLAAFPRLKKRHGKKVFEIRPNINWHKGKALTWLLQELDAKDGIAVFIGDDDTDEDAFRAIRGRGLGVRVGPATPTSMADYYLDSTDEVRLFLETLICVAETQ